MRRVFVCVLDGCRRRRAARRRRLRRRRVEHAPSRHRAERRRSCPTWPASASARSSACRWARPRRRRPSAASLERGAGKDTTTGHWEMMGLVLEQPFPTYPHGFPPEVIEPFERAIGRGVLCNRPASGTEIIERLGDEHVRTGKPIVYTSADSVFQIACHEDVVPLEQLYEWCLIARAQLQGEHAVGRVIARPFAGASGTFARTRHRRDYSLPPTGPTYLDLLGEAARAGRRRGQDRRDLHAARRRRRRSHAGQRGRHRRLRRGIWRRWTAACCSPTSSTSTRSGAIATTSPASPPVWRRSTTPCRALASPAARRRRADPLRRPRRRPDHGEHRPLARVLAAAGLGPCAAAATTAAWKTSARPPTRC